LNNFGDEYLCRHQINFHLASQGAGGFAQGVQRDRGIGRIQQPIHRRAAGFHPCRHLRLGQFLLYQKVIQLKAQRLFSVRLDFAEDALFIEEIPEVTATMVFCS
jgi:hypothetical protein